jgi:polyphosphate kinase
MKKTGKTLNFLRDPKLSWMDFNHRVLQEAADSSVPLIERLRFLGIYSNNLDEFFRVRVATLQRLLALGKKTGREADYPKKPKRILALINRAMEKQRAVFERLYAEILNALEKKSIRLLNEKQLNTKQAGFLREFFEKKLVNSLNPVILTRGKEIPPLVDANIYLLIDFHGKEKSKPCALVEVPTGDFTRFIQLPDDGEVKCLILLDDVIRFCLDSLFSSIPYEHLEAYTIKITRDAGLDLDRDLSDSLLEKISRGIKNRKCGEAVRLVYDRALSGYLLKFIQKGLQIDKHDTMSAGGRYHNFKDFMKFPDLGRGELVNPPMSPVRVPLIDEAGNLLELAKTRDFSLHYPYQDFSYLIRLLREAAIDPGVRTIKITMYRLAGDSRVVRALINAARNGKQVTAVVELFARFDESANVDWARAMQDAGVRVVLGVEGLKIHSKLIYIGRHGGDIACVSTGNFHEGNARVYTDFALFTADPRITREIAEVFDFIDQPFSKPQLRHLLLSPLQMRKKLILFIRREMDFARKGREAWVIGKINHLADPELIACLREAGQLGVKIRLIVRGNCALIPELCENIELTSIVDRYLEHSRIFLFANGGEEAAFLSSADWMRRNFDDRLEVAIPVYDPEIRQELRTVVEYGLRDNVKARIIEASGQNKIKSAGKGARRFRSQLELTQYYQKRARLGLARQNTKNSGNAGQKLDKAPKE